MVEIKNLSFSYSDVRVLKNVSLCLETGKTYGLLGHNGAGKTTLFRALLDLVKVKSGEIIWSDCGSISYLPENNGVYDKLTVIENLEYRATLCLLEKKEVKHRIDDVITKLKLGKYVHELTGRLSQGLKKRLTIACMLVKCGDLRLLDEPTNGLDPESRDIITKMILDMSTEAKTTVVISHDLEFIKAICDTYYIMQDGAFVHKSSDFDNLLSQYLAVTTERE